MDEEELQGRYEHLRDLYYRKYGSFSLLKDDDINHLLVTYYNDTWMQLLARMNWYETRDRDEEAGGDKRLAVA